MPKFFRRRASRFGGRRLKRQYVRRRSFKRKRFTRGVKRAVNKFAEKKYSDTVSTANVNAEQIFGLFGAIVPGTSDFNNRVGKKATFRSLDVGIKFSPGTATLAAQDQDVMVRVIVFNWKDEVLAPPSSAADILAYTAQNDLMVSQYNRVALQTRNWQPMYDRVFSLKHPGATLGGGPSGTKSMRLKFYGKRLPMKNCNFTAGNVPDHRYYMLICTNQTGATNGLEARFSARITYTDV